jgi:hypothetical protein
VRPAARHTSADNGRRRRCAPKLLPARSAVVPHDGRDVPLHHGRVRQLVWPEPAADDRLCLEAPDFKGETVTVEQVERDAPQVERELKLMGQDDGDGSRVLADQPLRDHHRAAALIVEAGRSMWQLDHGLRPPERLVQAGDLGAEVPVGHIAGADLGEQAQPLGRALGQAWDVLMVV